MDKKKIITIILTIFFLVFTIILGIVIFGNINDGNIDYKTATKYSMKISVDIISEGSIEPVLIGLSHDGKNTKISSSKVNMESYIISDKLYYLKDNTFYVYEADKSYEDLYDILNSIDDVDFNKESGEYKYYTALLKTKELNDILDSLFFSKKSSRETVAKITVKDDMLYEFNVTVSDIEGYEKININIQIEELESDYTVDTSKVWGTGSGIIVHNYKRENTRENVYEIVK